MYCNFLSTLPWLNKVFYLFSIYEANGDGAGEENEDDGDVE